jgi:hypothetical protein
VNQRHFHRHWNKSVLSGTSTLCVCVCVCVWLRNV